MHQTTLNALDRATIARVEFEMATIVHVAGMSGLLAYLNSRTRFRYTGVYRFDPPWLRNVALFDRENPDLIGHNNVHALEETYCSIVRETESPFETGNAPADPRLLAHPGRERIISYVGVPIRLASGVVWGVLCHHDVRPRMCPAGERSVMETAALKLPGLFAMQRDSLTARDPAPPDSNAR